MPNTTATDVTIKLDGSPLDATAMRWLDSILVENAVNLPDSFTVSCSGTVPKAASLSRGSCSSSRAPDSFFQ